MYFYTIILTLKSITVQMHMSTPTAQLESHITGHKATLWDFRTQLLEAVLDLVASKYIVEHRELDKNPHHRVKANHRLPLHCWEPSVAWHTCWNEELIREHLHVVLPAYGNCLQRCQAPQKRKTGGMPKMPPQGLVLFCLQQEFQKVPLSHFHSIS